MLTFIMTTIISKFVTPEVQVQLSNITINPKQRKATLTLGTKAKGKRKFNENIVEVSITSELYNWFCKLTDNKVKVAANVTEQNPDGFQFIKTGSKSTGFQKFLQKIGKEFTPGILKSMVFTSTNTSTNYQENPFRIVMFEDRAIMTLVNIPSKKRTDVVDITTGEIKSFYSQKYGKFADGTTTKAFVRPEKYRRLVVKTQQEVEVIN